jgi:elongation factor Tu
MTKSCWNWSRWKFANCCPVRLPGDDLPVVRGSALKALEGEAQWEEDPGTAAGHLDTYIPEPERASTSRS